MTHESDAEASFFDIAKDMLKIGVDKASEHLDADRGLQHSMAAFIEAARLRYAFDPGAQWKPGKPLKLLLAGYSGTRNTGADVRVEEMIRQFRHLFGDEHVEMSIYTIDPELTDGYFRTVRQLHLPKVFPKFLFDSVHEQHAVVACEGSMFKSKFANALSTMMVGSLGLALAEQKIAVGYGGEAGTMDRSLEKLIEKYMQDGYVIARNQHSQTILSRLGVACDSGTDTAWPFEPSPKEFGDAVLKEHGWDGQKKVLALCPINPFWWPVKPDVGRAMMHKLGGDYHDDAHYASVYFHKSGSDVDQAQERYLQAIARASADFAKEHDIFIAAMGSEKLDRHACERLVEILKEDHDIVAPVIVSDDYNMYDMVSIMRSATYMVSSRYHAIVTTMAGSVVSAGITMDERIANLMKDRGTPELALRVDDVELEANLRKTLKQLIDDEERIRVGIDECVYNNLERMGRMGQLFVEHVKTKHPEFPFREELGLQGSPWDHLPPFCDNVAELVTRVRTRRNA